MWIGDDIRDLARLGSSVHLAIGVFDGLHLGHRAVIDLATASAAEMGGHAVVVTFEPHPATVLRPEAAPALLTCREQKLRLFREVGVRHALLLRFDREMAKLSGEEFLDEIMGAALHLASVTVGPDWRFGAGRSGDTELLRRFGLERGFRVRVAEQVEIEGERVSSTAIRRMIAAGELERAARFLGRNFSLFGHVVHGAGRGRSIGFPTANVQPSNGLLPPDGVYAATVLAGFAQIPSVLNLGTRPTVNLSGKRLLEVHLLDFDGDLYGHEIEVIFEAFLRSEQRFDSIEALSRQIREDIATARRIFRSRSAER